MTIEAESRIRLSKADITQVEEQHILDEIRSGWVAPLGSDVEAFEAEIATLAGHEANCWLTCIVLEPAATAVTPAQVIADFASEDIES